MGGQACVLYGAAEFSRDADFAILCEPDNLDRLRVALADLQTEVIAVPPFETDYLLRGHAVHFRCRHPEAESMRLDVMAMMRGVDSFPELWDRRTTFVLPDGNSIDVLALPDLVKAKKTQRDKDWPMIRRLVENHYFQFHEEITSERVAFWSAEARTVEVLRELWMRFPDEVTRASSSRPLLRLLAGGSESEIEAALNSEEQTEREKDRAYWRPLRLELEQLRLQRRRGVQEDERGEAG
jgi:hypothetical protein